MAELQTGKRFFIRGVFPMFYEITPQKRLSILFLGVTLPLQSANFVNSPRIHQVIFISLTLG